MCFLKINPHINGQLIFDICAKKIQWERISSLTNNTEKIENPHVRKLPYTVTWRRKQQPTPVFVPGEFHGQKVLVGYSPWGYKESDMTEQLTHLYNPQN